MKSIDTFFALLWYCISLYVPHIIVVAGITIHWGLVTLIAYGFYLVVKHFGRKLYNKVRIKVSNKIATVGEDFAEKLATKLIEKARNT
jgi:hypothetical protein